MRIVVLGAGAMGEAVTRLLARHSSVELLCLDADPERAERAVADTGGGVSGEIDVTTESLPKSLQEADAVAACLPYTLNLRVMEAALETGTPYADLGGLYHMTLRQLELDERFREAGVPAILGIGCAPGITNLLARLGADRLDTTESVDLIDGAVEPGDGFHVPYAAETILDEFTLPAMVYEDGRLEEVPACSGAIRFEFPQPVGEMEAFYTLHSELATLPRTIEGVRNVRWRLALPPPIAQGFKLLVDLGLAERDPVDTPGGRVVPRALLLALLARLPASTGPAEDAEIAEVRVSGTRGGRPASFLGRATFQPTPEGISAGAFGTAVPIAAAARWLAAGRIVPGVHPPETALPPQEFLADLAAEGVQLTFTLEENLSN